MKIYLGGPINGCTDEEASGWREAVKEVLSELGHKPVDPMDRDYRGREMEPGIAEEIVEKDKHDILNSDVLLMNCPRPSYGTAMEVLYGWTFGKLVYVVMPDDGSEPSPWIVYHSRGIFRGSAIDAAKEILS